MGGCINNTILVDERRVPRTRRCNANLAACIVHQLFNTFVHLFQGVPFVQLQNKFAHLLSLISRDFYANDIDFHIMVRKIINFKDSQELHKTVFVCNAKSDILKLFIHTYN